MGPEENRIEISVPVRDQHIIQYSTDYGISMLNKVNTPAFSSALAPSTAKVLVLVKASPLSREVKLAVWMRYFTNLGPDR